jgi:thiosulfate/3-mercaptopyruvate sulfurtransferase
MSPSRAVRAALSALALVALAGLAPVVGAAPIVEPAALAARVDAPAAARGELRIVDIRDGRDAAGRTPFDLGHLPGAVHAPYAQWRGPKDNPGRPLEPAALTALVQRLGIDRDTEVVIVHEGKDTTDFGAAARVYWTLKTAGLTRLAILDGGVNGWRAAGRPLVTDVVAVRPSAFVARPDARFVATRDEVVQAQATQKARLIDARPRAFFEGDTRHVAAKAPGTIAGASNLDSAVWFARGSGAMLPAAEVRRVAAAHGIEPGSAADSISFCNTGHWAATNWFVMSEVLGERNVRLYPESMVEWSRAGLPMENVPNRLRQLLIDLKLAGN